MNITTIRSFLHTNQKELKRFVKFAIVGGLGSVSDITVLNILVQFFGIHKIFANIISVSVAILQNFVLNRFWTFPESRNRNFSTQMVQFTLVNVAGLGINTLIFGFVDHLLLPYWQQQFGEALGFTLSYNFAKLFAIGIVLFWNFTANRLWTYRGLTHPAPPAIATE